MFPRRQTHMNGHIPLALALLSSGAMAQTVLTLEDAILTNDFGLAVAGLDDLNGDGRPEVAVGQGGVDTGAGGVRVFDSATGLLVHSLPQPIGTGNYGFALASASDFDGDGFDEFLVGAPGLPTVFPVIIPARVDVISGQTGQVLVSATTLSIEQLGYSVAGMDDVNGDAIPDFAAGANASDFAGQDAGRVYAFSGADGSIIWFTDGDAAQDAYGQSLARIEDVDGDGTADLLAGAPGGRYVDILSGVNGAQIRRLSDATAIGANIGFSVDATGDLNGDGIQDVVAGSPSEDFNGAQSGGARVFSGGDGSILFTFHGGFTNDHMGYSVSGAGDLNFDTVPDLLIGAPEIGSSSFFPTGTVRVTSGADGSVISFEHGPGIGAEFGRSVDFAGSVDGGPSTWLAGAPAIAQAFAHAPDSVGIPFCTSTPNSSGLSSVIQATGSNSIAVNDLTLLAGPMAAGQPGLFYYGSSEIQVPFGNGFRCIGGAVFRLFPFAVSTNSGALIYALDHGTLSPAGQITAGQTVKFQAWFRDPAGGGLGFDLSDGLSITFAP